MANSSPQESQESQADPVERAAEHRIRAEALRLIQDIEPDPDDDGWRMDPIDAPEPGVARAPTPAPADDEGAAPADD